MARKPVLPPERTHLVLERVVSLYEKALADCPDARRWLAGHGIEDPALLSRHRVGYGNGSLGGILPADGRLHGELRAVGIFAENGLERFRGCVVFPVLDPGGQVRSLCGTNTRTGTPVLLPGLSAGIWNAAAARMRPVLFVTDTVPDALALDAAGLDGVLAMPDRARLSPPDLALFAEYGTRSLVFVAREQAEAWGRIPELVHAATNGACRCRVRVPPGGQSLRECLKLRGPEAVAAWLEEEEPAPAAKPARAAVPRTVPAQPPATAPAACLCLAVGERRYEILGLEKAHHRLKVTVRAVQAGRLHIDTLDLYNARSRRAFVCDLAMAFDQPHELAQADVQRLIGACEQWTPPAAAPADTSSATVPLTPAQRAAGEAFGRSPTLIEEILEDYRACGLVGEDHNKLLCYLAAVSRKMDTPLSVLLLASSGAGKSAIQSATLAFCPEEDVVRLTSLTGKALFYRDPTSLRHRLLALEEGAGAESADYAIRSLISSGELAIESVTRDAGTGALRAVAHRVYGPTAVFYTVTDPEVDPETRSRFFVIGVDESSRQTAEILATQRAQQRFAGLADERRIQAIREKHRSFQRLLRPLAVVNPYATQLAYSDDRLQARRDQPRYLNLIRSVAFLRQMAKEVRQCTGDNQPVEYVEVEPADIDIATRLAVEVLGTSLDELSTPARDLLLLLEEMVRQRAAEAAAAAGVPLAEPAAITFTRREVREHTGWNRTRLQRHLCELLELEYVVVAARARHGLQQYRLLYAGQGRNGSRFLLGLDAACAVSRPSGSATTVLTPASGQESPTGHTEVTQQSHTGHTGVRRDQPMQPACGQMVTAGGTENGERG